MTMRCSPLLLAAALSCAAIAPLAADTFGSGTNTFSIDFVPIGSPGNPADTNGYGAVAYEYRIGVHEVSTAMAEAASSLGGLGLTPSIRPPDQPATGMSWNQAARFVNWLNTNSGYAAAYKFALQPGDPGYDPDDNIELWATNDPGYNPANPYRNAATKYFLPGESEWYKAAYFNPAGTNYFPYPTGSATPPTQEPFGTNAGTAVFGWTAAVQPAATTNAGGLSPFGTMAQGGNAEEWIETASVGVNTNAGSSRTLRGGMWTNAVSFLESSWRALAPPSTPLPTVGFRVASAGTNSEVVLTLQSTTNLSTPWQPVTLTPSMITPEGQIDLGAAPGGGEFYRLQIEVIQP
jgi:hypothetical protein